MGAALFLCTNSWLASPPGSRGESDAGTGNCGGGPAGGAAQAPAAAAQVTVESYYRIKWGSAGESKELYKRNDQPILDELRRQGFLVSTRMDERDLRVALTYPNAAAAVPGNPAYDKAAEAIVKRLYPEEARLEREEARRFSLLEEHWDVIVSPAGE